MWLEEYVRTAVNRSRKDNDCCVVVGGNGTLKSLGVNVN